jgi:hypothetical protein
VTALDRWLPEWEFDERHETLVAARPDRVDRAMREVSLFDIPVARGLWALRSLGRGGRGPRRPFIAQMGREAGVLVVEDHPGEELVVGLAGQFWKLRGGYAPRFAGAQEFAAYDRGDSCKAVMNFRLEPEGDATRLSTVTRVHVSDRSARRKFARYWFVIRPFSGLIRILMLREIKRKAEAAA